MSELLLYIALSYIRLSNYFAITLFHCKKNNNFRDAQLIYQSRFDHGETFDETGYDPEGKFAIILHGWRENCEEAWIKLLIKSARKSCKLSFWCPNSRFNFSELNKYRGGCIICMDYGYFAKESYVRLMRIYEPMVQILTLQLLLLDYLGFDMSNGYMFGFSYGGQMATEAGRRIGHQRFKDIDSIYSSNIFQFDFSQRKPFLKWGNLWGDQMLKSICFLACDMAGPGFDHHTIQPDHRVAAQNVQCIHTSRDKGTRFYNCHQDWRLGNCGFAQPNCSKNKENRINYFLIHWKFQI